MSGGETDYIWLVRLLDELCGLARYTLRREKGLCHAVTIDLLPGNAIIEHSI